MLLESSKSVWIVHHYYPESGRSWPFLAINSGARRISGFGCRIRTNEAGRIFVARYVHSGRIWFQAHRDRHDVEAQHFGLIHHSDDDTCTLSISFGGGTRVLTYRNPASSFSARLDPTYDEFDREHDDFLLFAARHVGDSEWRDGVRHQWVDGARP